MKCDARRHVASIATLQTESIAVTYAVSAAARPPGLTVIVPERLPHRTLGV
jgi:hypothetical protein